MLVRMTIRSAAPLVRSRHFSVLKTVGSLELVHDLRPTIAKLAGGMDELAEALMRPGVEIVAGIDRELARLAELGPPPTHAYLARVAIAQGMPCTSRM